MSHLPNPELIRSALEIPDCDCPPTWYGEYFDVRGQRQRVKLTKNKEISERHFQEFLAELAEETGSPHTGELLFFYPVCEHVLSANHGLDFEEWTAFLISNFNKDYQEPASRPRPTLTWPGTQARASVYSMRVELGLAIFDQSDLTTEKAEHLHREVGRRRNGSLEIKGIGIAGEKICG